MAVEYKFLWNAISTAYHLDLYHFKTPQNRAREELIVFYPIEHDQRVPMQENESSLAGSIVSEKDSCHKDHHVTVSYTHVHCNVCTALYLYL